MKYNAKIYKIYISSHLQRVVVFLALVDDKSLEGGDLIIQVAWQSLWDFGFQMKYLVVSFHEAGTPAVGCLEVFCIVFISTSQLEHIDTDLGTSNCQATLWVFIHPCCYIF